MACGKPVIRTVFYLTTPACSLPNHPRCLRALLNSLAFRNDVHSPTFREGSIPKCRALCLGPTNDILKVLRDPLEALGLRL